MSIIYWKGLIFAAVYPVVLSRDIRQHSIRCGLLYSHEHTAQMVEGHL